MTSSGTTTRWALRSDANLHLCYCHTTQFQLLSQSTVLARCNRGERRRRRRGEKKKNKEQERSGEENGIHQSGISESAIDIKECDHIALAIIISTHVVSSSSSSFAHHHNPKQKQKPQLRER